MYGQNKRLLIQLHVTPECDQNCQHCYVSDTATYEKELTSALKYPDFVTIVEDIIETAERCFRKKVHFNFAGGDPLLWPHLFELMSATKDRGASMSILGNPHHLDDETCRQLHKFELGYYQVSLDGMQTMHDSIRARGSFEKTIAGIRMLKKHGIRCGAMFTLSRRNKDDLLDVAKLCAEENVDLFSFDSLVPLGNSKTDKDEILSAVEWRETFHAYSELKKSLGPKGYNLSHKGPLWTLHAFEKGAVTEINDTKVIAGCPAGISMVSILSDGSVLPCRRLPITVGKMPEQKFLDIYRGEALEDIRQVRKIEKCRNCKLFFRCRGCRALAYAMGGSVHSEDPLCWKSK